MQMVLELTVGYVVLAPSCTLASLSMFIQQSQASPAAVKAPMPLRTPLAPPPAFAIIATFDPRAIPPAARPLQQASQTEVKQVALCPLLA